MLTKSLNDDEIQIVVELMGRIEPARTFITKALEAGKNVVSANKDLIATHGKELISLAQDKGVAFYYELPLLVVFQFCVLWLIL